MIRTMKDGRTIRNGKHYKDFRYMMHSDQGGLCMRCGAETGVSIDLESDYSFHVHHRNGRGLGGGKRDDTVHSCEGLCGKCHRKEHGQ